MRIVTFPLRFKVSWHGHQMTKYIFLRFCFIVSICFYIVYRLCLVHQNRLTNSENAGISSRSLSEPSKGDYDILYTTQVDEDRIYLEVPAGMTMETRDMCWSTPQRRVTTFSCVDLMEGNEKEIARASSSDVTLNVGPTPPPQDEFHNLVKDCDRFKTKMRYLNGCVVTEEEANFPIAYSILVHRDAFQLERLLRAIYRPHNFYCIHVDKKAESDVLKVIQSISDCFDNVFLTEDRENVIYAHYSRLKADFNCMSDLLRKNSTWKYVINLTGQMFPLKTNREIVKILSSLRGTNDVEGFSWHKSSEFSNRYANSFQVEKGRLKMTSVAKTPPPLNVTLIKGSAFGSFSREFVEYVLRDKRVKVLLEWLKDSYSPDEFIWPTINSRYINPMFNAPGAYDGTPERLPWVSTFAAWTPRDKCRGKSVRTICIFGVGDLQQLISRPEIFANKFYANYQPLVLDCLEEWLMNKTLVPQPFPVYTYLNRYYYLHPQIDE